MEQWEALIEACPTPPDLRYFSKAIQTASVTLKEDLAHFESEWILQTLLHKPVNLIKLVSSKRTDDAWLKLLADSFRLLTDTMEKRPEDMERHIEEVVDLCLLTYDAITRQQALHCLTSVTRTSPLGAKDLKKHIADLENVTSGRAPLAVLVGTICEHHPQLVESEINKIWRIYLNLLDSNKNTDRIRLCLLQGLLGILKHFGMDLPVAELSMFYDKIVSDYIRINSCEKVCLSILAEHATLFRERLSKDSRLRNFLWNHLHNSTGTSVGGIECAKSVYQTICGCLHNEQIQHIARTELLPQVQSHRTQVKYTALRILTYIRTNRQVDIDIDGQTDVQTLEFELRNGNVSYDIAEAISWCIEAKFHNSENLLQAAIVFYENLPSSRRKSIVVHNILTADDDLRNAAIKYLISESTREQSSIDNYQTLWRDLFDTNGGKDVVVMNRSKLVYDDFMSYVVFVLEELMEEEVEKLSEKLLSLLHLISLVLTYQTQEEFTNDYCIVLLLLLTQLYKLYPDSVIMRASRNACSHINDATEHLDLLNEFYQMINIDGCKDESLLCECCLALMEAPVGTVQVTTILIGLQIIFTRNDVEPQMLSKALQKLENWLTNHKESLDVATLNDVADQKICQAERRQPYIFMNGTSRTIDLLHSIIFILPPDEIILQIEKLHRRKDSGKEARILHRDVLMFLGKYGTQYEINSNAENTIIVKIMDTLFLTINTEDGTTYKLNLQRIVQLALEYEDPNSLHTLLVIVCVNLSTRNDPNLGMVLTRICHALSRAHARGVDVNTRTLQAGIAMCDNVACVQGLLQYISSEKSPGVRKMISDALETILMRDREDMLISSVAERVGVMMTSCQSTTKRAGLNITETVISSLKENNALIKNLLSNLLTSITKTNEIDSESTFLIGAKLFLDKIELFEREEINKLVKNLLKIVITSWQIQNSGQNKMAAETEVKIFKNTTNFVLAFVKDCGKNETEIVEMFFEVFVMKSCFEKVLYVLAKTKEVFDLNIDLSRILLTREKKILDKLFCMMISMEEPYFGAEVVLKFFEEYKDILLELHYQKTMEFLGKLIETLTPQCIKHLHRNIKTCLTVYIKTRTPAIIQVSFENWFSKIPIKDITGSIEKELFTTEHSLIIFALKIMLKIFDTATLPDIENFARNWAKVLLKLYSSDYITNYLKSKISYLTDLLTISVRFLKVQDVKKIILEGCNLVGLPTAKIGVQFCRFFMHVFYDVLVKKPFVLLEEDMAKCCVLLKDIVKYSLKKKHTEEKYMEILELVNELWPTYELNTTFTEKLLILQDLNNFPKKLGPESKPMQWAVNNLVYSEASREDKARLIGVLPGGECYCQAYRSFASMLPARLSEVKAGSNASLRALLDALANTGDMVLLDIVMTLASGDQTKGWWDEAIESCMATLAARGDLALCKAVYTRCWDGHSLGVCRRVLLPLLRYSTSKFNEIFFSTILNNIFKVKEPKVIVANNAYHKAIVDYTRTLSILQLAFEKIPPSSLESPSSSLYKEMPTPVPLWHIVRSTCTLCYTLKRIKLPEGADEALIEDYRRFQCAKFNCFAAAICCRRPEEKFYNMNLFDTQIWDTLVSHHKQYKLWIRHQWNERNKMAAVSIAAGRDTVTSQFTARSRMFLRTLTENPLMYDLIEDKAIEEVQTQNIQLPSNELNEHECAGTLTALLCHVSTLPYTRWRELLSHSLLDGTTNARWLLAQAICNCAEELKPHASALRSGLLAVVATTPVEVDEKKILNGLHVQILETLVQWKDDNLTQDSNLNTSIQLLITTALVNRKHDALFRTLSDLLSKILSLYCKDINVNFEIFEPYLADPQASKTFQLLQCISKCNVHIPSMLPTLLNKMENKQAYQLPKPLVGLAMNACKDTRERQEYLIRFRKVLDQQRKSNPAEYIKMLYHAQNGCPEICDQHHFRMTVDLTSKLQATDKNYCLKILTNFASNNKCPYILDMYETIDMSELIIQENVDAFSLISRGVKIMNEQVKKRLVNIVAGFCQHSLVNVRKAASEVMLNALEDLFNQPEEPSAKKIKTSITPMISKILSKDVYFNTILNSLAFGTIDKDGSISCVVREGVAKMLSKDIGIRFAESFLLTIYLPSISNTNKSNLSVCTSAFLEILLSDLRSQERFKRIRLRDDPLENSRAVDAVRSKLLTMSRTYQGSFRGHSSLTSRRSRPTQEFNQNTPDIDVQITIEKILDTLMDFSKETPAASKELSLLFVEAIKPQFELGPEIAKALAAILENGPNELTPFICDLCRLFVDDVCRIEGFKKTVEKMLSETRNSEGEVVLKLLLQEVNLRCLGHDQFVLGCSDDEPGDVIMDEDTEFCIEDLTSAFGKLSNWENLTTQQKNHIQNSGLPPLWTSKENFVEQLDSYSASAGWFSKMTSAYRQQDKENVIKWLRETDQWPRRHFHISAITEAIQWQSRREEPLVFPCDIQPTDCLAEWAARFMIRATYQTSLQSDTNQSQEIQSTRQQELIWCVEANERGLGSLVLDCIKRNTVDLCESDTLSWLHQRVLALRAIGTQKADNEILMKALNTAERYSPLFAEQSSTDIVVGVNKAILLLNRDLGSLSKAKIEASFDMIERHIEDGAASSKHIGDLNSILEISMVYYDGLWDNGADPEVKQAKLSDMLDILVRCTNNGIYNEGLISIILNKLDSFKGRNLSDDIANKLLEQININLSSIDDLTLQHLASLSSLFPSRSLSSHACLGARQDVNLEKYRKCFQLVCDAEYTLLNYCSDLRKALKCDDEDKWCEIFRRVKEKLFENPYAGSDYQLLNRYKNKLYEICEYDISPSFKMNADKVLKEIGRLLVQRPSQSVLRLSQLCPTLSHCHDCPGKLLGLRDDVTVVRIDEQVTVFNSIRRPALFKVLLSDGSNRRYLHKCGEPLTVDAAAQKMLRYAGQLWKPLKCPVVCYNVIPLSEDCGLIEYLEDHETLRALIGGPQLLDAALDTVPRPADNELILSPIQANLGQHNQLCDKIPSHLLRDSITKRSVNMEDRYYKMKQFQCTLSSATILTWILGIGDRHLENILYSIQNGRLCNIDWGAILQFGSNELPVARLTRNLLAVCDIQELEAKLQKLLSGLRDSREMFLAVVKMSFKWMGEGFDEKCSFIQSTLNGSTLSYNVTRQVMENSEMEEDLRYKYMELLDNVFGDFEVKNQYTVDEQITCLLRHCTDQRILSVTRRGWEPWV